MPYDSWVVAGAVSRKIRECRVVFPSRLATLQADEQGRKCEKGQK